MSSSHLMHQAMAIFCGSSPHAKPHLLQAASQCGQMLAERHITLIYGGGSCGMMGHAADGCLRAGGNVTGIYPQHLHTLESPHMQVSELVYTECMHSRKHLMYNRADGFIIMPGGFGTLDEFFEILTWKQLGLHDKPIFLLDIDHYWQHMLEQIAHMMAQEFVRPQHGGLFTVLHDMQSLADALKMLYPE